MKQRISLVLALLLLPLSSAHAWWEAGHMAVDAVAETRLSANAKSNVTRLLAIEAEPRSATFVSAGVWADDLKEEGVRVYDRWHYTDTPHSPDGTPMPKEPHADNAVWAVGECMKILKNPKATDLEKSRALKFVMHIVGDLHNPLHCGTRYTKDQPEGDRGGNGFTLENMGTFRNLHAYWDSVLGLFPGQIERPLPPGGEPIAGLAKAIITDYPADKMPERTNLDPNAWTAEGKTLLTTFVYNTGPTPDAAYTKKGREIARRQIALAGYRLADLLNGVWP